MESETRNGLLLIAISLVMLPVTMDLMQYYDDASDEYERECDINYRIYVLDNNDPIDGALCLEIEDEMSKRLVYFIGSIAILVLSGLCGIALVLPQGENDGKQPPMSGQLR
ncbi:MAG: hypothetical protein VYC60_04475 [Candidatus Thermoplasmatota archaeon]|nr:hypothetical protein [Candidatus Thermoplasmatota archaeon]